MASALEKIAVIGSGNWGSVIAKILGTNVLKQKNIFHPVVNMWVYEELIGEKKEKLSEIINTTHVNVKYLPGTVLPESVVAVTDVAEAAKDATILVFVIPHQFIGGIAKQLTGKLSPRARAISLIKGVDFDAEGNLVLISKKIEDELKIPCSVLMGANVADEVAKEFFCETTIGSKDDVTAHTLKLAFETPYFVVSTVHDVEGVELCGALKNVVAIAAGVCDGLGYGGNTKAAIMRLGLMEMKKFAQMLYPSVPEHTFMESAGVADLITTCYGGRNRKVAEAFAQTGKSFEELEKEMLDGQKLQGTGTSKDVRVVLKKLNKVDQFPLFDVVYKLAYEGLAPKDMINHLMKGAWKDADEFH